MLGEKLMISDSKNYIENVTEWIDEIEDIDAFLEQLFLVNEQSLASSPSLDTFCMSLSINTTDNLISSKEESLYGDIFRRIERCSSKVTILESQMNIPESIFNISLFEKIEEDTFSCISEKLSHVRGLFNETSFVRSQSLPKAA
jgi:hypothetical protein